MSQKQRKMSMASSKSEKFDGPWHLKLKNAVMGDGSTSVANTFNRAKSETALENNSSNRTKSETALENNSSNWSGQKLITNVKVEAGTDELNSRRALAASKSPAELAQINSLAEIPIPGTLKRMVTNKRVKIPGKDTKIIS